MMGWDGNYQATNHSWPWICLFVLACLMQVSESERVERMELRTGH